MSEDTALHAPDPELRLLELIEANPVLCASKWAGQIGSSHFTEASRFARFQRLMHATADPTLDPPVVATDPPRGQRTAAKREFTRLAQELQARAIRRDAMEVLRRASERLGMWNADHRETLATTLGELRKLLRSDPVIRSRHSRARDAVFDLVDHLEQEARRAYRTERLWTPFHSLDSVIGRFLPGWVYLILGRPVAGKTALATQLAAHLVGASEQRVALLSGHASFDRLVRGFVAACSACGVPGTGNRHLSERVVEAFCTANAHILQGDAKLLSHDRATLGDLEVLLETFPEGPTPSALIVDGPTPAMLGQDFGIAGFNRLLDRLMQIAANHQVSVIMFAGQSSAGDQDGEWLSASLAQHPKGLQFDDPAEVKADFVADLEPMIPTEEKWSSESEVAASGTFLRVLKNSFGPEILIGLEFDHDNLVFEELEEAGSEQDGNE